MNVNFFELDQMSDARKREILRRSELDISRYIEVVRPIIDDVRTRGDAALAELAKRLDGADLSAGAIAVTDAEIARAEQNLDPEIKDAIRKAAENIKKYHHVQMPKEDTWFVDLAPGVMAGEKITPITSVGLYVPRGKGCFPSVVLMLCIPAVTAGVESIIVCTPPTPNGGIDDASLFAANLCGVRRIFKSGGAQAIAAMAFGTATIPKVHKVLGPGNAYVSAAKRLLYGHLDVGVPAGPSESIILCDGSIDPRIAAADLLIEAEHGPDSTALLVTHSREVAMAVKDRLPELIGELPPERRDYCTRVLSGYGGIVLTPSLEASIGFVNEFAPEHLEVLVEDPMGVLPLIKNAGEILLGPHTPITLGNFSLGVNAILPTGGFARTFSCVTVFDFLKRSSIGKVSQSAYEGLAHTAGRLAQYEGFPAHANALRAGSRSRP